MIGIYSIVNNKNGRRYVGSAVNVPNRIIPASRFDLDYCRRLDSSCTHFRPNGGCRSKFAGSKMYRVFFPNGKTKQIRNLKAFCSMHSIPYDSAQGYLKGSMKSARGFKFERIEKQC